VPAVLVDGVIAPELALMVNPLAEEYFPPDVPVLVTGWAEVTLLQKGVPEYEIVAEGKGCTVTLKEALFINPMHPAVDVSVKVAVPAKEGGGVQSAVSTFKFGEKKPPTPLSDQNTLVVPPSMDPPRDASVLP